MKRKVLATGEAYRIESGIPIARKRMEIVRFPFDKMKVGDSFLVPTKDQDPIKAGMSIYTAVKSFNAHNGKAYKVATRKTETGLRVWRIL